MCPYTIDDVNVDFEGSLSMVPKPFPETSKGFFIKQLSTRQAVTWKCLFVLHDYHEIQNCKLRISFPPTESFPIEDDVVIYSQDFGVKILDLMCPSPLQTYHFS